VADRTRAYSLKLSGNPSSSHVVRRPVQGRSLFSYGDGAKAQLPAFVRHLGTHPLNGIFFSLKGICKQVKGVSNNILNHAHQSENGLASTEPSC
jgi:hypothetical protein